MNCGAAPRIVHPPIGILRHPERYRDRQLALELIGELNRGLVLVIRPRQRGRSAVLHHQVRQLEAGDRSRIIPILPIKKSMYTDDPPQLLIDTFWTERVVVDQVQNHFVDEAQGERQIFIRANDQTGRQNLAEPYVHPIARVGFLVFHQVVLYRRQCKDARAGRCTRREGNVELERCLRMAQRMTDIVPIRRSRRPFQLGVHRARRRVQPHGHRHLGGTRPLRDLQRRDRPVQLRRRRVVVDEGERRRRHRQRRGARHGDGLVGLVGVVVLRAPR